jgi:hypothetical protein
MCCQSDPDIHVRVPRISLLFSMGGCGEPGHNVRVRATLKAKGFMRPVEGIVSGGIGKTNAARLPGAKRVYGE